MEVGYLGFRGDPSIKPETVCLLPFSSDFSFLFLYPLLSQPSQSFFPNLPGDLELEILLSASLKEQTSSDYMSKQQGRRLLWPLR